MGALLRERGFIVMPNDRSQVRRIYRPIGKRRFEVANFDYFERLVQYGLLDEKAVVDMIEATAAQAILAAGDKLLRAAIRPRFMV